jgi:hypothetical protein
MIHYTKGKKTCLQNEEDLKRRIKFNLFLFRRNLVQFILYSIEKDWVNKRIRNAVLSLLFLLVVTPEMPTAAGILKEILACGQ